MYQYLYLIDILYSVNNTLNIITIFTFFISLFLFIVYVCSDNSEITKKCKKVLNMKVFITWLILVLIGCILPSKLTMYSYALESVYENSNNTELYQDVSKFIKQKILEETTKE